MSLKLNTSNKILAGSFFVHFHKMFSKEDMRERERERERCSNNNEINQNSSLTWTKEPSTAPCSLNLYSH